MVGIIIASHGDFAAGLKQTSEMIFGHQEKVMVASLKPSQGPNDIHDELVSCINALDSDEIIIFVDLLGGTPFNQANAILNEMADKHIYIVTGMNLAILLECYGARFASDSALDIVNQIMPTGKEAIEIFPQVKVETKRTNNQDQPVAPSNHNGKLEVVLTRVDSRLLHGQVATGWVKAVKPNRILVVSNEVAHDELRKKMIAQAAPSGVKVNCIPLSKYIAIQDDMRFGGCKALVLFETIDDVLSVVNQGVKINSLNLGSMAHKENKVSINAALSMNLKDVTALESLISAGIDIDIRKVPADTKEDVAALLKKAHSLLDKG